MKRSLATIATLLSLVAILAMSSCSRSGKVELKQQAPASFTQAADTAVWSGVDMESGIIVPAKVLSKENVYMKGDTVWVTANTHIIVPVMATTKENRLFTMSTLFMRVILRQELRKESK